MQEAVIKYNRHHPGNAGFALTDAHMLACPLIHTQHTCHHKQACMYCTPSPVSSRSGICSCSSEAHQAGRLKKSSTLTICSFGVCSENRSPRFSPPSPESRLDFLSITTFHIKDCTESSENKGLHGVQMLISCSWSVVYFLSFGCLLQAFELHHRLPLITRLAFIYVHFFFFSSQLLKCNFFLFLFFLFCFRNVQISF